MLNWEFRFPHGSFETRVNEPFIALTSGENIPVYKLMLVSLTHTTGEILVQRFGENRSTLGSIHHLHH